MIGISILFTQGCGVDRKLAEIRENVKKTQSELKNNNHNKPAETVTPTPTASPSVTASVTTYEGFLTKPIGTLLAEVDVDLVEVERVVQQRTVRSQPICYPYVGSWRSSVIGNPSFPPFTLNVEAGGVGCDNVHATIMDHPDRNYRFVIEGNASPFGAAMGSVRVSMGEMKRHKVDTLGNVLCTDVYGVESRPIDINHFETSYWTKALRCSDSYDQSGTVVYRRRVPTAISLTVLGVPPVAAFTALY